MKKRRAQRKQKKSTDKTALQLGGTYEVLTIDSSHDETTRLGFAYRESQIYPYLASKGLALYKLQGPLARREYVKIEIAKTTVRYVTGIGHGFPHSYTGDYFEIIFSIGNYDPVEPKGKIIHLCSCDTAILLGPDFVSKQCLAYFGYDKPFTFQKDSADIFFECDGEIDRAFADGLTAGDVHKRVVDRFQLRIRELESKNEHYKAETLGFNRDHLRSPASGNRWGDTSAKL